MFKKLKKIKLPFISKRVAGPSLDELIVAALEEAKNYPLIADNEELSNLFKTKFVTKDGIQVPPKEFVAKIISYIENNPPLTTQQFDVFVKKTISIMTAQVSAKKDTGIMHNKKLS